MRPWKSVCAAAGAAAARASISAARPARITRRAPAAADGLCIEPPVVSTSDGPCLPVTGTHACQQSGFPQRCDERVDQRQRGTWNCWSDERTGGTAEPRVRRAGASIAAPGSGLPDPCECTRSIQTYELHCDCRGFADPVVRGPRSGSAQGRFNGSGKGVEPAGRDGSSTCKALPGTADYEGTATPRFQCHNHPMPEQACSHIEAIESLKQPGRRECEECVKIRASWVHLRTCQACGVTRCCDIAQPSRQQACRASRHPVVASAETRRALALLLSGRRVRGVIQVSACRSPQPPPSRQAASRASRAPTVKDADSW